MNQQFELKDLDKIKQLNLPFLQEAVRQVELFVQDENDRKCRIDQRTYTLLALCSSLIAVLLGVVSNTFFESQPKIITLLGVFALVLVICIVLLLDVLSPKDYAPIGSEPDTWLNKEDLEEKSSLALGNILVQLLYNYRGLITHTKKSNNHRLVLLTRVIKILIFSTIFLFFASICSYFWHSSY